ncbi:MAG: hypothetical protein AAFO70_05120 [Pseudomonadota bacterium]
MPAPLPSRRALLRRAHEHYHVPLEVLAGIAEYTLGTMERLARTECWQTRSTATALRARLTDLTERTIVSMSEGDDDVAAIDRVVRNVGALSKVVETLAACEAQLAKAGGQTETTGHDDPFSLAIERGAGIAELDQLAARLVAEIDRPREAEPHSEVEGLPLAQVANDGPGGATVG